MSDLSAIVHDTGEVVAINSAGLNLPGRVMQVGLELPDNLSFEEWQGVGEYACLCLWTGDAGQFRDVIDTPIMDRQYA